MPVPTVSPFIRRLHELGLRDAPVVGGKNAAIGEVIGRLGPRGVRVPPGFATTARAYRAFLEVNRLEEAIEPFLLRLRRGNLLLSEAGASIRERMMGARIPVVVARAMRKGYAALSREHGTDALRVAVRSSPEAGTLPEASFAGQQENLLNVLGPEKVVAACLRCFVSLFADRAIRGRRERGVDPLAATLSVGVQRMVRADEASAGTLLTSDPEGAAGSVVIRSSWGLGELVVKARVHADRFVVRRPGPGPRDADPILEREVGGKEEKVVCAPDHEGGTVIVSTSPEERQALSLKDDEVLTLARWGRLIEEHFGGPVEIEWAKDGRDGGLYVVQARMRNSMSRPGASGSFRRSDDPQPVGSP